MGPRSGTETGSAPDEARLIRELRDARPAAFEVLVRTYGPTLRAVAYRLLRNWSDSDDAVQEAFLSAFKALGGFEGKSSLSTWLHRIVLNACLMRIRARRSRPEEALEDLLPRFTPGGTFADHPAPWHPPADEPLLRQEEVQVVQRAIDRLPEKFCIPLILRDIEELSNEDLATSLGISVNAAKIRVHRARQALRTLLEPHMGSGE